MTAYPIVISFLQMKPQVFEEIELMHSPRRPEALQEKAQKRW